MHALLNSIITTLETYTHFFRPFWVDKRIEVFNLTTSWFPWSNVQLSYGLNLYNLEVDMIKSSQKKNHSNFQTITKLFAVGLGGSLDCCILVSF